jgi:hypothetical protein
VGNISHQIHFILYFFLLSVVYLIHFLPQLNRIYKEKKARSYINLQHFSFEKRYISYLLIIFTSFHFDILKWSNIYQAERTNIKLGWNIICKWRIYLMSRVDSIYCMYKYGYGIREARFLLLWALKIHSSYKTNRNSSPQLLS